MSAPPALEQYVNNVGKGLKDLILVSGYKRGH